MIIRDSEHKLETNVGVFGGAGEVHFKRIIEKPEELYNKGRVFSVVTLDPGSELGWHIHKGDGEFYCFMSGVGEYNDNGKVVTVYPGDTAFCADGEGHSIVNRGSEPLVFMALVVYN